MPKIITFSEISENKLIKKRKIYRKLISSGLKHSTLKSSKVTKKNLFYLMDNKKVSSPHFHQPQIKGNVAFIVLQDIF